MCKKQSVFTIVCTIYDMDPDDLNLIDDDFDDVDTEYDFLANEIISDEQQTSKQIIRIKYCL